MLKRFCTWYLRRTEAYKQIESNDVTEVIIPPEQDGVDSFMFGSDEYHCLVRLNQPIHLSVGDVLEIDVTGRFIVES